MNTAIIIGRFQIDRLHLGYHEMINDIEDLGYDKIVFFVGTSEARLTDKNPLPFDSRKKMLLNATPNSEVLPLKDHPSDEFWSKQVDQLASQFENPVLFCSRDSFKEYYSGSLSIIELKPKDNYNSTERRKEIGRLEGVADNLGAFRQGIIFASQYRFPTAFPTVDVAIYNKDTNQLLLGRKPGRDKYCFVGGFVDPTDLSLEAAAARECGEEVKGISVDVPFTYLGSMKINDFRYRGTSDGIITSFFLAFYQWGKPEASDDLEEVKWFSLNEEIPIAENHLPLLKLLKEKI